MKDINLKVNYSFYKIKDYVAGNPLRSKSDFSTWLSNLEEMRRHGVEFELNGDIFDNLWFYTSYAFMDWKSMGGEPGGKVAVAEHPKHKVKAGLRYNLFKNSLLMLDYQFQSKRVIQRVTGTEEDYDVEYIPISSYQVFDFALEQTLFKKYGFIKDAVLKFYVNNLFDEKYESSRGYPMTDRTYGTALSFTF